MNFVEPIRDPEKVRDIANYLREQSKRNYLMYELGINTALRISDIRRLRVVDVAGRDTISMKEKKTRKHRIITLNSHIKVIIKECISPDADHGDYLFQSRQGVNQPLSRCQAYRIIKNACAKFGVYNVGTHTLRKTFGYHFYRRYKDITQLQEILEHATPDYTLRYIGFNRESIEKALKGFRIY